MSGSPHRFGQAAGGVCWSVPPGPSHREINQKRLRRLSASVPAGQFLVLQAGRVSAHPAQLTRWIRKMALHAFCNRGLQMPSHGWQSALARHRSTLEAVGLGIVWRPVFTPFASARPFRTLSGWHFAPKPPTGLQRTWSEVRFPAGSCGRRSAGPSSNRPQRPIGQVRGARSIWSGFHMISLDAYCNQWFGHDKADPALSWRLS